jgi:hypothetical protein
VIVLRAAAVTSNLCHYKVLRAAAGNVESISDGQIHGHDTQRYTVRTERRSIQSVDVYDLIYPIKNLYKELAAHEAHFGNACPKRSNSGFFFPARGPPRTTIISHIHSFFKIMNGLHGLYRQGRCKERIIRLVNFVVRTSPTALRARAECKPGFFSPP